jgi:ligand-binding sensor domain-containing protein
MKSFIFVLATLFVVSGLYAQSVQTWQHYSDSNTPECLIQDGPFLWVGTDGGLIKFDKSVDTFAIFNPQNSGLSINSVVSLTRGKDGSIWAGTRGGGLASLQGGVWSTYTTKNSQLPSDWVSALAADSLGRIWVGTNGGLVKIENGIWTIYSTANTQFLSNAIDALATDPQSNVWISTTDYHQVAGKYSLLKFDGASAWEFHDAITDQGFDVNSNISSLLIAKNGDLWLGMEGYLDHIHNRVWDSRDVVPEYNGAAYDYVRGLAEDNAGGIWVSTQYGAGRFDGTKWTDTLKIETNTFPYLRSDGVVFDHGDVWFISSNMDPQDGNGLALLRNGKWSRFDSLSNCPLTENWLTAMTIDSKGRYWFGERNLSRVSMFDGKSWTYFDGITQGAYTMSMCADSSGNVYIGTGYSSTTSTWVGLIKFDGVTPQYLDLNALIHHSNVISALAYNKQGVLWIGTQYQGNSLLPSGLVKYDGTNFTQYDYSPTTLPEGEVSSLVVDPKGGVWVATWYGGIAHFDGASTWVDYHAANSAIPSDQVFKVDKAQNGDIWIATLSGAAKWNGTSWRAFTTGNSGIIANLATCGVDSKGNVWFGAFNGSGGLGGATEFDGTNWTTFTPANSAIGSNLMENIMGGRNGDVWFETYDIGIIRYNPDGFKSPCLSKMARLSLTDNASQTSIQLNAGDTVRSVVAFMDSVLKSYGLTTVQVTLSYDSRMLTKESVRGLNGWTVVQEQDGANSITLTMTAAVHDGAGGEQIAEVDFKSFIGTSATAIASLTDTRFNPADSNFENCTLASIANDSLVISLTTACGNTTLKNTLNNQPLLQLVGINPDPASTNGLITVSLAATGAMHSGYRITSAAGIEVGRGNMDIVSGLTSYAIQLPKVSEGVYFLTINAGADRLSEKFAVR